MADNQWQPDMPNGFCPACFNQVCICYELALREKAKQDAKAESMCPKCTAEWANQLHRLNPFWTEAQCEAEAANREPGCWCEEGR